MNETLEGIADHIEATAKREKAEVEALALSVGGMVEASRHKPGGNAAQMREALEYLLKERDILDFCHNNLGSKTWEDWDKVYKVLRKIIEKAMRALAAPPRNCDRFNSGDCNKDVVDASLAWDKFCAEHYPPGTPVVPKTPYSFWSWVFAQANESEVG